MYDVTNSLYRDAGCPGQCSSLYEYASVDEMNGINGALPIPESTAKRFYQTPSTVNAQGQVVNPVQPGTIAANPEAAAAAIAASPAATAQFIRMMNRRY
jgi:hypothetical protein